jgi:gliding motility-associated-like protein
LIIALTTAKNLTEMKQGNGGYAALKGGIWHDHSSGYSYYTLPLSNSDVSYGLKNPAGLIVLMYGLGNDESYYYVAGTATRKLNAYFEVDGIHHQSFEGKALCDGEIEIEIEASVKYQMDAAPGHLRWLINDVEQTPFTDNLHWKTELPEGNYIIQMIVKSKYEELDSIAISFTVGSHEKTFINDTICQHEPYNKNGFSLPAQTETGIHPYQLNLLTTLGCDSIIYLDLLVNPVDDIIINGIVCQGENYNEYGFSLPPQDVAGNYTHQQTRTNMHGCDSIITLNLKVEPLYEKTFTGRVSVNELYDANGFSVPPQPKPEFLIIEKRLNSLHGCDSVAILHLTVYAEIIPDKYFFPGSDGVNNVWRIKNIEGFEVVSVEIYNRFGKVLVRNTGHFTPWDGKYLGKEMPSDDYWYVITLKEKIKQYVGHFTLLR